MKRGRATQDENGDVVLRPKHPSSYSSHVGADQVPRIQNEPSAAHLDAAIGSPNIQGSGFCSLRTAESMQPTGNHAHSQSYRCFLRASSLGLIAVLCVALPLVFLLDGSKELVPHAEMTQNPQPTVVPTSSQQNVIPTSSPTTVASRVIVDRGDLLDAISEYIDAIIADTVEATGAIESWDVRAVTDMSRAFSKSRNPQTRAFVTEFFDQDLSRWDVSNVENMDFMFYGSVSFNSNLSLWNTSKVTSMTKTFAEASSFNGDLRTWDTSRVRSMSGLFESARAFNQDISRWSVSLVTTMEGAFYGAESFHQDISEWDIRRVTSLASTFGRTGTLEQTGVELWDVSNVQLLERCFSYPSFNGDLRLWNTSAVVNMDGMFDGSLAFDQDISAWDVSRVTSTRRMFAGAKRFNQNISWNTKSLSKLEGMFTQTERFNSHLDLDLSNAWSLGSMFAWTMTFNQSLSHWNVSNVKHMGGMFRETDAFHQDLSSWDVREVVSMERMFYRAKAFNGNVNTWQTIRLTNAQLMFSQAESFNQDISGWNLSRLVSAASLLQGAQTFNQNLCRWSMYLGSQVKLDNFVANTSCPVPEIALREVALCHAC